MDVDLGPVLTVSQPCLTRVFLFRVCQHKGGANESLANLWHTFSKRPPPSARKMGPSFRFILIWLVFKAVKNFKILTSCNCTTYQFTMPELELNETCLRASGSCMKAQSKVRTVAYIAAANA